METNAWDWNRMIQSSDYYKLSLVGWPGWDKLERDEPPFVMLTHTHGDGKSSRDLAIEFDDVASMKFWYRDFTDSGIPIVRDGDVYCSMFVFQSIDDMVKFRAIARKYSLLEAAPTGASHPGQAKSC